MKCGHEGVVVFGASSPESETIKTPKKVNMDEEDNEVRHTEGAGYDTVKVLPRY